MTNLSRRKFFGAVAASGAAAVVPTPPVAVPEAVVASITTTVDTFVGTGNVKWSDIYLASGGEIKWNNGDATITLSSDALEAPWDESAATRRT